MIEGLKFSDFGSYSGGIYISLLGKLVDLSKCKFSELRVEVNYNKVILGKVVCIIVISEFVFL